jgi:hypothetical protein
LSVSAVREHRRRAGGLWESVPQRGERAPHYNADTSDFVSPGALGGVPQRSHECAPESIITTSKIQLCSNCTTHDLSWRGTARAQDARGTPTQSHISPSILVCEGSVDGCALLGCQLENRPEKRVMQRPMCPRVCLPHSLSRSIDRERESE